MTELEALQYAHSIIDGCKLDSSLQDNSQCLLDLTYEERDKSKHFSFVNYGEDKYFRVMAYYIPMEESIKTLKDILEQYIIEVKQKD